jgi:hypothetical protein
MVISLKWRSLRTRQQSASTRPSSLCSRKLIVYSNRNVILAALLKHVCYLQSSPLGLWGDDHA